MVTRSSGRGGDPGVVPGGSSTVPGREWIVRWLVAVALVSIGLDALLSDSVLAGDPRLFNIRADALLEGQWPYFQAEFEHLPIMIPYILGGRLLTSVMPGGSPALAYCLIGLVLLAVTSLIVPQDKLLRWMMVATPMAPIALFRLDALPVAVCMAALAGFLGKASDREVSLWSIIGGLAKGWPIVTAPLLWRRGSRRSATAMVTSVLGVVLVLSFTPGFQSGRDFDGVHTETLPGSWFLLRRSMANEPLELIEAAWSIYVAVPRFAVIVQVLVAMCLLAVAFVKWLQPLDPQGQVAIAGSVVAAVLIASPLLSSQFVFWLAPFVVLAGRTRSVVLYTAIGAVTLLLLAHWRLDEVWWSALALLRVGGIAGLSVLLALDASTVSGDGDHRPTRTLAGAGRSA